MLLRRTAVLKKIGEGRRRPCRRNKPLRWPVAELSPTPRPSTVIKARTPRVARVDSAIISCECRVVRDAHGRPRQRSRRGRHRVHGVGIHDTAPSYSRGVRSNRLARGGPRGAGTGRVPALPSGHRLAHRRRHEAGRSRLPVRSPVAAVGAAARGGGAGRVPAAGSRLDVPRRRPGGARVRSAPRPAATVAPGPAPVLGAAPRPASALHGPLRSSSAWLRACALSAWGAVEGGE